MVIFFFLIYNLFLVHENIINGYKVISLDIASFSGVLSAVLVIISKNPILSVLFLIGLFLTISLYLIFLGLNFIGLSYLLVYIGAVSILFLFILMLINVRISELLTDNNNSIPLLIIITISLYSFISNFIIILKDTFINNLDLNNISFNNSNNNNYFSDSLTNFTTNNVSYVSSYMWDGNLAEYSHIASIGNIMYSNYSIWLILTSIILLLAMVGCIVITIKRKTNI